MPSLSSSQVLTARLAPSPTGAQHVGNARTYLLAWLSARSQGGRVLLRIEDLDSPRVKPWTVEQAITDLRWLGLDWDGEPVIQTTRLAEHRAVFARLMERELVYPCTCSRTEIAAAASAPHLGQEGPLYPGTCAGRTVADAAALGEQPFAWRFRLATAPTAADFPQTYDDLFAGRQSCDVARELGDFVIAKADGTPAYQLAVVVDDLAQGVTEVLRGDDLIPSTFRQLALYHVLNAPAPRFGHVPLVLGPDGRRLAKRHGDTRISLLRERGHTADGLVGLLAWSCGLRPTPAPTTPRELLKDYDPARVPRTPFSFTPELFADLLAG
jgi:glutamyl-tRNA synthetase